MTSKRLALLALLTPVVVFGFAPVAHAQDGYSNAASNLEIRLTPLEDQIRALTGKTEQLDYAVRRLDQFMQRMQSDMDMRLTRLENAPPPAAAQPVAITPPVNPVAAPQAAAPTTASAAARAPAAPVQDSQADQNPNGRLGDLKVQGQRVTGGSVSPKAPPLPAKPEDYGLTPSEQYDRALGLLRQANYEEAEKAFRTFIEKNPQDKQIENARYWYGETFYVRGKFNDAAVAFAESFEQAPKGVKAPDALLKLGMSLGALGKVDDACTTYASLKKQYPNAPVALRSRVDQERARFKCK